MALKNLLTMVSKAVLPLETGSSVTKSKAIWVQGLPGNGRSKPAGGQWDALPLAQTEYAATNCLMSFSMVGHQKCLLGRERVCLTPRWQAKREV